MLGTNFLKIDPNIDAIRSDWNKSIASFDFNLDFF